MERAAPIAADLSAIEAVRTDATRRSQLAVRAVVLIALAASVGVVLGGWAAVPLVAVAALCAALVVLHEIREHRRRRGIGGSLGRTWT